MRKDSSPLVTWHISCGFPSPAGVCHESELDIYGLLITHPGAAFYVRVSGDSMEGAGIFEGDVLVVDRALDTRENAISVALVHGDTLLLMPENPRQDPLART